MFCKFKRDKEIIQKWLQEYPHFSICQKSPKIHNKKLLDKGPNVLLNISLMVPPIFSSNKISRVAVLLELSHIQNLKIYIAYVTNSKGPIANCIR